MSNVEKLRFSSDVLNVMEAGRKVILAHFIPTGFERKKKILFTGLSLWLQVISTLHWNFFGMISRVITLLRKSCFDAIQCTIYKHTVLTAHLLLKVDTTMPCCKHHPTTPKVLFHYHTYNISSAHPSPPLCMTPAAMFWELT